MRRNWILPLTAFSALVLVWSLVCHADPATGETPKAPDDGAGTKCCKKDSKGECCVAKDKSAGCKAGEKAKCCAGKEKSTGCKAGDKAKCGSGDSAKCGSGKGKCSSDRKVGSAKEPDAVQNTYKKTALSELTVDEQKILQYLEQGWNKRYRATNIEQAMTALGMPFDDQQRRNVGEFLKQNEKQIGKLHWGWITFTLTNNEKHLGRYIAFKESKHEPITSIDELGKRLKVSSDEIKQGLRMLRDIGFLLKDASSPIGYKLSRNAVKLAEPTDATFGPDRSLGFADHGSLGFTTHTVRVNDGPEFNVQCFADYIILAEGRKGGYGNEVLTLRDAGRYSVEPITVTYEKGKMVKLEPKTAIHVATRGCGGSNVFSSMEHYRQWKKQHPKSGVQRVKELKTMLGKRSKFAAGNGKCSKCDAEKDKCSKCVAGKTECSKCGSGKGKSCSDCKAGSAKKPDAVNSTTPSHPSGQWHWMVWLR